MIERGPRQYRDNKNSLRKVPGELLAYPKVLVYRILAEFRVNAGRAVNCQQVLLKSESRDVRLNV